MVEFYDLVNKKDGNHFSPFAWRSLLALKHKGIEFNHYGLTFTEINEQIPKLSNGEWTKVPLIKFDDETLAYDSPKIADYLEANYLEKPLFPNGRHFATFLENYMATFLPLFKSVILDVFNSLEAEEDIKYFRSSREALFKVSLEEFAGKKEDHKEAVDKLLLPFRTTLVKTKFLEGDKVAYSDYILFGHLKFIQMVSIETFDTFVTKHKDPVLNSWFNSIQNLYDGFGASFKP